MNQWQIGNVKVTRVVEMEIAGGSRFILPQATRDEVKKIPWLAPHFADEEGRLIMSVHALVIETPTRKMIVDTCIGNDKQRSIPNWSNLQLPFLEDLKAAGYDRHDIDTVMCTHLHVDHVGWNTMSVDGEWIPTFPNARYLMAKPEYEYWDDEDAGEDDIMVDSIRPVFEAGLVDLVETDHVVCDEVFFEPTFGHTPGHVSVHIRAEGEEALITGDCIHHPCQIERLDWASSADYDQSESTKTRHSLMDKYADQDILIIGTHFATPTAGHLKSNDSGYWLDVGGTT
ncbi:MAG: MBL fold metallo-hydrolase [Pseudomonadales bacterium]|nr:MBL fold metallo-hydrolase [Pseudomonadales bacterium]MBO6594955.1 MBL fold metallo-hydrolase [Pseudomonadales bacterium]MBO6821486.1 MBL fold metallo-hydrolase [Pseudomonadales bacterium]